MVWKIGNISIRGDIILASMTKITDLPFRMLCRDLGASLAFTGMVNCNAVSRGNKAAMKVYSTSVEDAPLGIQLLGSQPNKFVLTTQKIGCPHPNSFFDINFSCPDRNVLTQGAGAALLRRPKRMKEIISNLIDSQPLPITAKIRLPSPDIKKSVYIASQLENAGVSAISIHARTIKQKNSGLPRLKAIKSIKNEISIPIIGNGGVDGSIQSYGKMKEITGCDAVMIGKAAIYNPGLFSHLSGNKNKIKLSIEECYSWLKSYVDYSIKYNVLSKNLILQRAIDFLRSFISINNINKLYHCTEDVFSFLSALKFTLKINNDYQN